MKALTSQLRRDCIAPLPAIAGGAAKPLVPPKPPKVAVPAALPLAGARSNCHELRTLPFRLFKWFRIVHGLPMVLE